MAALAMVAGVGWAQTPASGVPPDATEGPISSPNHAGSARASDAKSPASVSFLFDRPGLPVPHFLLTVREDGSGRYEADEAAESGAPGRHVDRTVTVSAPTVAKIFAAARAENSFNVPCASKIKKIADTGTKTLSYAGPDGSGSCVYNYSERKIVQMLTDTFLGMAFTMDEGRKLEFKRRFDRLGLDAEMISLEHAAEQKQALEMGTIAGILSQIAHDTELMERVRLRAAKLLEVSENAR